MKQVVIALVFLTYDVFFQMDESFTARHVRCLWKFSQFTMRELTCPRFTNAKAFALGAFGAYFSYNHIQENSFTLTKKVLPFVWLSSVTLLMSEGFGLCCRLGYFYENYFLPKKCCAADCSDNSELASDHTRTD